VSNDRPNHNIHISDLKCVYTPQPPYGSARHQGGSDERPKPLSHCGVKKARLSSKRAQAMNVWRRGRDFPQTLQLHTYTPIILWFTNYSEAQSTFFVHEFPENSILPTFPSSGNSPFPSPNCPTRQRLRPFRISASGLRRPTLLDLGHPGPLGSRIIGPINPFILPFLASPISDFLTSRDTSQNA
jgi:hypothetical protein